MLDQGRSLLLGTLRRYRSPANALRAANPELANALQSIGFQLDQLSTSRNRTPEQESVPRMPIRDYMLNTQRQLLNQWDELLEKIRALPGFEDFLTIPTYPKLQLAARDGPCHHSKH